MSITEYGLIIIIGTCLVTLIPRVLPIMLISKITISEKISRWLEHVPISVMTALLVNELLIQDNAVNIGANILELIVAIPTFFVAIKSKSPILTVVVGIVSLMILRMFF